MSSNTLPPVQDLPLDRIRPNPNPLRPNNERRIAEIAASMRLHGQLSPAVVRSLSNGNYELVDGSHRLAALRLNDASTIRCEVRELSIDRAFFAAWSANANRNEFMDGIAEGRGFDARIREGYSQTAIAREIGRPQQYVSGRIGLLRLPAEIQELITRELIPVEHGIELSRLEQRPSRILAQLCRRDSQTPLTLEDLRALAGLPWDQLANDPRVQPLIGDDPNEQIRRLSLRVQASETRIGNIEQDYVRMQRRLDQGEEQVRTRFDQTNFILDNMYFAVNEIFLGVNAIKEWINLHLIGGKK